MLHFAALFTLGALVAAILGFADLGFTPAVLAQGVSGVLFVFALVSLGLGVIARGAGRDRAQHGSRGPGTA